MVVYLETKDRWSKCKRGYLVLLLHCLLYSTFLPHAEKENPWSVFHKRRPVKTDHTCSANSVYLIWFPCTLHCLLSCTFSFPSGRLGRQLASQQTPTPQLGSWQAAIAFLFVETVCLAGPHGTLAHYNPFALGTWLPLLALGQEFKGFNWLCNNNDIVYDQALENIWTIMIWSQFAGLSVLFIYLKRKYVGYFFGVYSRLSHQDGTTILSCPADCKSETCSWSCSLHTFLVGCFTVPVTSEQHWSVKLFLSLFSSHQLYCFRFP